MIYDLYCQGASDSAATPQLYNLGPGYGSTIYCMLPGGVQSGAAGVVAMKPIIVTAGAAPDTGLPADFDYSILGAVFAFAVSVVVAMYVLGRGAGVVLSIFRK